MLRLAPLPTFLSCGLGHVVGVREVQKAIADVLGCSERHAA
jgi:hypothetical protein